LAVESCTLFYFAPRDLGARLLGREEDKSRTQNNAADRHLDFSFPFEPQTEAALCAISQ
jgi:hypothetical protein